MSDFSVTYLGQTLHYTENQCVYLRTTNCYRKYSIAAKKEYMQQYASYKNFKTFAAKGIEDGYAILKKYLMSTVQKLVQLGNYDMSQDIVLSRWGNFIFEDWIKIENLVEKICEESDIQIQEAKEYRNLRKAARGKLVGGGFGIKGAAKGIVLASSFNALTGVAHSSANAIGNAITKALQTKKLNDIYASKEMQEDCENAISLSVQKMGAVLLECQNLYKADIAVGTPEMKARVQALRGNYSYVPDEKKEEIAVQILSLDPSNIETYQFLLKNFGDKEAALFKLSKEVGIEDEYKICLKEILDSEFKLLSQTLSQDIARILPSKFDMAVVIEFHDRYHQKAEDISIKYGGESSAISVKPYFTDLLAVLNNAIRQYLTSTYFSTFDATNSQSMHVLVEKVKTFKETAPSYLSDTISEICSLAYSMFQEADIAERTFHEITFNTIDERRDIEKYYTSLGEKYLKTPSNTGPDALQNRIDELKSVIDAIEKDSKLPKQLQEEFKENGGKLIQKLQDKLTEQKTYDGVIFDTVEARMKAERDYNFLIKKFPLDQINSEEKVHELERRLYDQKENLSEFSIKKYENTLSETLNRIRIEAELKEKSQRDWTVCAVSVVLSIFAPLFVVSGENVSLLDLILLVITSGLSDDTFMSVMFLLIFVVPMIFMIAKSLVEYKSSKDSTIDGYFTASLGVAFFIAIIICGLVGNSIDSTMFCKVSTLALIVGGVFLNGV